MQDVINTNSWNGTVLESFLFSDVNYVVFLSEKTPALLEQCVLEGGGIEIKFKQKNNKKSIKNASLYLEAPNSAACNSVHFLDF